MILWGFEQWKEPGYWSFQGAKWMTSVASESCAFVQQKQIAGNPWIRPMVSTGSGWVKGTKRSLHSFLGSCALRRFQGSRFLPGLGSASSHPTLKLGSTGPAVSYLQTLLVQLGYYLYVTGIFEAATLQAVMSFQNLHGLVADGVVGPTTWVTLEAA